MIPAILALVPTLVFASLLMHTGMALVVENLRASWQNLTRAEFGMVVAHCAITAASGMLAAVLLGLVFTAFSFIVEYAKHSGVYQTSSLLLERSSVHRPPAEHACLDERGGQCAILHLYGMVFFGSANSVVERVRALVKEMDLEIARRTFELHTTATF